MYKIIYFSPTGNTKFLANKLAVLLNIDKENIYRLEDVSDNEMIRTDHLVFMYPIHGFNAPRTVKRFVKNIEKGLFFNISLLAVGCNDLFVNDAVSNDLKKQFKKKGYKIVVDEILAMPITIVIDFPDKEKEEAIEKSTKQLNDISENIKNSVNSTRKVKLPSKFINLIGKLEDPAARLFGLELHAKKSCISCGICWENCPENNIRANKNNVPKFGFSCMMCMRCIYDCPEQSITPYISKFITIKGGYRLYNGEKKDLE